MGGYAPRVKRRAMASFGHRSAQGNTFEANTETDWEIEPGREVKRVRVPRIQGYTTEAVRLATAYLFGQEPIDRVQILLDPRNVGSRTVAERVGYTPEGTLRHAHFDRGEHLDLLLFSVLRSEATLLSGLLAPLDE